MFGPGTRTPPPPVLITPFSLASLAIQVEAASDVTAGSQVWPASNLALYVPLYLDQPITIKKLFWANGATVSGNVDCGIYTEAGSRVVSTGSTAQSGTSTIQEVDITDTYLVGPARYYMALAMDNGTGEIFRSTAGNLGGSCTILGMAEQTSAFALPSTATFASCTRQYIPTFGISLRA